MNVPKPLLREKLSVLDGARGLAILLVVCFHYVPGFSFGWMGVDLFFVLSGFLITGKLLESVSQKGYFYRFYRNRLLRIVPLYYLVLFLFFILLPLLASSNLPESYWNLRDLQVFYWSFTANIYNSFHGWPENITIVHFWSLAAEMQFYLLSPFVIILFFKNSRLLISVIIFLVIAAVLFRVVGQSLQPEFHSLYRYTFLLSRMDAFGLGALLYVITTRNFMPRFAKFAALFAAIVLFLILIIALTNGLSWHYSEPIVTKTGYLLNALLWSSLLFHCLSQNNSFLKRFFESKAMGTLGKYSYAIYIFHLPVWILFSKMDWIIELEQPYQQIILVLLSAVTSYLLSVLSYYSLEKPFLSLKHKI